MQRGRVVRAQYLYHQGSGGISSHVQLGSAKAPQYS